MGKFESEKELAAPVVKWLNEQHWDVYQEVQFPRQHGIADIVAVQDGRMWIIECKTSLTFALLEQANGWKCHFRSIAVPKSNSKGRGTAYHIANKFLKLGIIEVSNSGVMSVYAPPIMREYHKFSKIMMSSLKEEQKTYCEAGSKGGGYYTPYKNTMESVKRYILYHPGCTLKEIMTHLNHEHHYRSDKTAQSSIAVALARWESDWCKSEFDKRTIRYSYKTYEEQHGTKTNVRTS